MSQLTTGLPELKAFLIEKRNRNRLQYSVIRILYLYVKSK